MPKKHRKKNSSNVCRIKKSAYLCNRKRETTQAKLKSLNVFQCEKRAFSSAGSEHLPYKQRVGGSNPSTPTTTRERESLKEDFKLFFFGLQPCTPPAAAAPEPTKSS